MPSRYHSVIVFGPSGDVGGAVAVEAHARGAKVWLAMRETTKSLTGILDDSSKFPRVEADLSNPDSAKAAIQKSGATAAFVYRINSTDGMAGTLRALKDAGVTFIVFLSSFTITQGVEVRQVPQENLIPYIHAVVEIQLEDLGITHVALRPGAFASNGIKMYLDSTKTPLEATVTNGGRLTDCIVPTDIGRIGGAVLVDRPSEAEKEIIYIFGPQLLTMDDTWKITMEQWDKEIQLVHPAKDEVVKALVKKGVPEFAANYLASAERKLDIETYYPKSLYKEGVSNIKKYSGHEATEFKDYIAAQKV